MNIWNFNATNVDVKGQNYAEIADATVVLAVSMGLFCQDVFALCGILFTYLQN